MSAVSTPRRAMGSDLHEPATNFVVVHGGLLEAVADTRVAREVARRKAGIGLVPDVGRDLVAALEALEIHFAPRALLDEPVGLRIADARRKGEVEAKPGSVDKVVHVGFME